MASKVIEVEPCNSGGPGRILGSIDFDGMAVNITSVTFGGKDLSDLYITTARYIYGRL